MLQAPAPSDLDTVLAQEHAAIAARRNALSLPPPDDDLVGIALSGGGVRSATVCLGVLEVLNQQGLLEKADYLSSVSGGGYTAGYVQATLSKHGSTPAAFNQLFSEDDISTLRGFGSYLAPKGGLGYGTLVGAYVYSFLMNMVWIIALFATLGAMADSLFLGLDALTRNAYGELLLCTAMATLAWHFLLHGLRPRLWSSRLLSTIEGCLLLLALPYAAHMAYSACRPLGTIIVSLLATCRLCEPLSSWLQDSAATGSHWHSIALSAATLGAVGFFANPNLLGFHRFYRDSLARAYLSLCSGIDQAYRLVNLNPGTTADTWGAAPYPLVNTCLNLQSSEDTNFAGAGSNEHFILSPLYCGSKLTGYASTGGPAYGTMTLATAMAISGAAVNPQMGYRTNRLLAFAMTILNMRLGYWAANPAARLLPWLTWWPWFHCAELVSRTSTKRRRILLSDGGHIENLGVFELLRRRCRLIIAVDSGADPDYRFSDLQQLIVQARNILGIAIEFQEQPEVVIRPEPSNGYSRQQFAIATVSDLPGTTARLQGYRGVLIYLKSSIKAPHTVRKSRDPGYLYKTWHTAFPHEPTSDQFFDEAQWNAYYTLGKHMAEELCNELLDSGQDLACGRTMTASHWHAAAERKVQEYRRK